MGPFKFSLPLKVNTKDKLHVLCYPFSPQLKTHEVDFTAECDICNIFPDVNTLRNYSNMFLCRCANLY